MKNTIVIAGITTLVLSASAVTQAANIDEELYEDDVLEIVLIGPDGDAGKSNVARFAAFSPKNDYIDEDLYLDDDLDIVRIGPNPR